jgi:hypothetical protein
VPLNRAERWLSGLTVLQRHMNNAIQAGEVTGSSLRREATTLRHCSPELAALGRPGSENRSAYQLARRACASFEQAARLAAAAARTYTNDGPNRTLNKLLDRSDHAFNHGINLLYRA